MVGERVGMCAGMSFVCVCKRAGKSSVMIGGGEKSIQGGSRQTMELFEGETHFPERFPGIAELQMTCSRPPRLVAALFPAVGPSNHNRMV